MKSLKEALFSKKNLNTITFTYKDLIDENKKVIIFSKIGASDAIWLLDFHNKSNVLWKRFSNSYNDTWLYNNENDLMKNSIIKKYLKDENLEITDSYLLPEEYEVFESNDLNSVIDNYNIESSNSITIDDIKANIFNKIGDLKRINIIL